MRPACTWAHVSVRGGDGQAGHVERGERLCGGKRLGEVVVRGRNRSSQDTLWPLGRCAACGFARRAVGARDRRSNCYVHRGVRTNREEGRKNLKRAKQKCYIKFVLLYNLSQ